jgi:hypothetical protein
MPQNPIARLFGSQVSGVIVIKVEDMPKCDEFSMTVSSVAIVVWSLRRIAPDGVTTLLSLLSHLIDLGKRIYMPSTTCPRYLPNCGTVFAVPYEKRNAPELEAKEVRFRT